MAEEAEYAELFDTREDGLRCVRFASGHVGVEDEHGKVILRLGKFKHMEFAGHDFVKLRSSKAEVLRHPELRYVSRGGEGSCSYTFYADMKSGQVYGSMPELHRYGDFEVAFLCGFMFTRTKECYCMETHPSFLWPAKNGLYLIISHVETPEADALSKMLYKSRYYHRCLIKGDEIRVYWLEVKLDDDSVVVMDDKGMHYYVWLDKKSGKAVWRKLGGGNNAAEKNMIKMAINDIEAEVRERMLRDEEETRKSAERQRRKEMKALASVVPFQIGGKWGLRNNGRMVVPPIYRTIQAPVGNYCAVESCPGLWGVIALDGKVEIDAKYEGVVIRPDGMVELTLYKGKTDRKKLKG